MCIVPILCNINKLIRKLKEIKKTGLHKHVCVIEFEYVLYFNRITETVTHNTCCRAYY